MAAEWGLHELFCPVTQLPDRPPRKAMVTCGCLESFLEGVCSKGGLGPLGLFVCAMDSYIWARRPDHQHMAEKRHIWDEYERVSDGSSCLAGTRRVTANRVPMPSTKAGILPGLVLNG